MRLAEFISANIEPILAEWEAFARTVLYNKSSRHKLFGNLAFDAILQFRNRNLRAGNLRGSVKLYCLRMKPGVRERAATTGDP
jgi:hypothetical protein